MASSASAILKVVEDRLPAPLARRFGTPAAAAWTAIFVLIATFGLINYGVGLLLDALLHPAAETAPVDSYGEPASVVVPLPPPAQPKAAPAAAPAAMPAATPRKARWASRDYRHGWHYRRSREPSPADTVAAPVLDPHAAKPGAGPTSLLMGGLPKRVSASGDNPVRKEPVTIAPPAPKLAPAPAATPKAGPPAN